MFFTKVADEIKNCTNKKSPNHGIHNKAALLNIYRIIIYQERETMFVDFTRNISKYLKISMIQA